MVGDPAPFIGRKWPPLDLRAGALPYRLEGLEPEFLLIRRRGHDCWAIPKGRLMAFREIGETARLEAYQEAGVHGRIADESIGSYIHIKASPLAGRQSEPVEVIVFPMEVATIEAHWPEMDLRERQWVRAPDIAQLVSSERLREMVLAFSPGIDRSLAPAE